MFELDLNLLGVKVTFERRAQSSDIANDRLSRVLAMDRAQISPSDIASLKEKVMLVLKEHFQINDEDSVVRFENNGVKSILRADFEIKKVARSVNPSKVKKSGYGKKIKHK